MAFHSPYCNMLTETSVEVQGWGFLTCGAEGALPDRSPSPGAVLGAAGPAPQRQLEAGALGCGR